MKVSRPLLYAAVLLSACGKAPGNRAQSPGQTPVQTPQTPAAQSPSTDDPTTSPTSAPAKAPAANDLASNPQTQGQVAASGLAAAASAAATGGAGSTGGASLALLDTPAQPTQSGTSKVTNQDCYLGPSLTARSGTPTPWPESTDASSIFANSKTDPADSTKMYVEPALFQYPAVAPTTKLTLSGAPFAFQNLVEVILKITGQDQIQLADKAKTQVSENGNREVHRYWVPKIGAAACGPAKGADAAGTSGAANGRWFKVKWSDDAAVDGLSLIERVSRATSRTKTYFPLKKGVPAATATTLNYSEGSSGYRLVQWTTSTTAASAVPGATVVRQKEITHAFTVTDQLLDANKALTSDISHFEEVRATAPMVIQEFRDAQDKPLAHIIQSGTVLKTGKDTSGAVKWFTTMAYNNVTFDLVKSSEPCIPVSGAATMTVFASEGGAQLKQVTITYTSTAGADGKLEPSLTVTGTGVDSTVAQWMMLHINRKCDLR